MKKHDAIVRCCDRLALFAIWLLFATHSVLVCAQAVLPNPARLRNIAGEVKAIAVQADGKVVIGGSFNSIDDVPRRNIARLNVDGSVDLDWNPQADATVFAVTIAANTIYAGGQFTHIGGQDRAMVALSTKVPDWPPHGIPALSVRPIPGQSLRSSPRRTRSTSAGPLPMSRARCAGILLPWMRAPAKRPLGIQIRSAGSLRWRSQAILFTQGALSPRWATRHDMDLPL